MRIVRRARGRRLFELQRFLGLEGGQKLDLNGYGERHVGCDLVALRSVRRELPIALPSVRVRRSI
jgi:hypothetical protein